jgi:hypothetical protein
MTFISPMHALKNSRRNSQRRRPAWPAPVLESLEDRALPSTLTVTSAADDGSSGTLRAVLAAAHNGDTIVFSKKLDGQTITLTAGQLLDNVSVQINGPGSNQIGISGNSASRIFGVAAGVTTTISGLTLSHGSATDGAGILNAGTLTLSKDVVTNNTAQGINGGGLFGDGSGRGGGVENQAGATLNVSNCTFSGNQANAAQAGNTGFPSYGGGIDNEGGTLSVVQSILSGNQTLGGPGGAPVSFYNPYTHYTYNFPTPGGSGSGGAINNNGGTLTVSGSTIKNNTAIGGLPGANPGTGGTGQGGGIASDSGMITVSSCTVQNNSSIGGPAGGSSGSVGGSGGAGIDSLFDTSFSLLSSTICGNVAQGGDDSGGGVSINLDVAATVSGTIFADNQVIGAGNAFPNTSGGGMYCDGNMLQMNGCQFSGNVSSGSVAEGGGLSLFAPGIPGSNTNLAISNTSFVGNVGIANGQFGEAVGGGILIALFTQFSGDTASFTNCTIAQNIAEASPGAQTFDVEGGGMFISGQSVASASYCTLVGNMASAAAAAPIPFAGFAGALAIGGGVDVDFMSSFTLANSTVSGNQAIGGPGGQGNSGGYAQGGGLNADGGSLLTVNSSLIAANLAQGGIGGAGGTGGAGQGGGISNTTNSNLTVTKTMVIGNTALGGAGGSGAAGGVGQGGGIYGSTFDLPTLVSIENSVITLNQAVGGSGGSGASGGNGEGGGLFIDAGMTGTVQSSAIVANLASGGAGGSEGSAGQGLGGGAYNLGTLDVDALSIIFANLASTSNNNLFGPITPI